MIRKAETAFLIMELLISLAIISIGFGSFLSVYYSIRRHHQAVQHRAAAVLLLQSVLEQVRAGQLPETWTAANWSPSKDGHLVCPAQPATYQLDSGSQRFHWQLQAGQPPQPGQLFTLQALITWQDEAHPRAVKATTQILLP